MGMITLYLIRFIKVNCKIRQMLMLGVVYIPLSRGDVGITNLYMRATIVSSTCTVSIGTLNQTVNLGSWTIKQFTATAEHATSAVRFTFNLEDCGSIASGVKVTFNGTVDSNNSSLFKLDPTSTASHVGVAILDRNKTRISPGTASIAYPLEAGQKSATLVFYAQYVSTGGTIIAGSANTDVTFSMEYL